MRNRSLVFGVFLFSVIAISLCVHVPLASTHSSVIHVPGDYPTIQEAVDGASDGDEIVISPGTYVENVIVDKKVHIVSEADPAATTVEAADPSKPVFKVTVSDVMISGFTISGASGSAMAGVYVLASDVNVSSCILSGNYYGIRIVSASNVRVFDNRICDTVAGIFGTGMDSSTIENNLVTRTGTGLYLHLSKGNVVRGNIITGADRAIIIDSHSDANVIFENDFLENTEGILIHDSRNNVIYLNNIVSGTSNGAEGDNTWNSPEEMTYEYLGESLGPSYLGNYWSDYSGEDSDGNGVGDSPYAIPSGGEVDKYPLMYPWEGGRISAPSITTTSSTTATTSSVETTTTSPPVATTTTVTTTTTATSSPIGTTTTTTTALHSTTSASSSTTTSSAETTTTTPTGSSTSSTPSITTTTTSPLTPLTTTGSSESSPEATVEGKGICGIGTFLLLLPPWMALKRRKE
ncbi:hypothetical protein A3L09_00725 [Thermococcus profundus]|uniref:Carbohydrate-binding/sugar hydrolysis domain-containing protein n=1 Tax=Thermococcus profundus TaxID=49899 RepID=A0A2Z2MBG2_THEPR|nr:NosD domain-containing protein [Thermococcus profundus]ASJ01885.1 hypothetical protein A3L09_00725 [Thermococcus profundus]